jgi:hypothetical protein
VPPAFKATDIAAFVLVIGREALIQTTSDASDCRPVPGSLAGIARNSSDDGSGSRSAQSPEHDAFEGLRRRIAVGVARQFPAFCEIATLRFLCAPDPGINSGLPCVGDVPTY